MSARSKSQSAMEYLMTYGWAILVVAIVLAVLFDLGVFTGTATTGTACVAGVGFLCSSVVLNSIGSLGVIIGQSGYGTLNVTGVACTSNDTAPATFNSATFSLPEYSQVTQVFQCPVTSSSLGTPFRGYLWLQYNTPTMNGLEIQIATISATVTTSSGVGVAPGGGGGGGGGGPPSNTYVYCVDEYGTTGVSAQISNGVIGSWATTNGPGYALTYPNIGFPFCDIHGGYMYCTAYGSSNLCTSSWVAQASYATASGGTLGSWASTNPPLVNEPGNEGTINTDSCFIYGSDMYCVAGSPQCGNPGDDSAEYSAVSSSGEGTWSYTTANYAIDTSYASCVPGTNGYVYCIGGYTSNAPEDDGVYSAQIVGGSTGLGTFSEVGTYPIDTQVPSCVSVSGYLYCVGSGNPSNGDSFSIPITGGGGLGNSGNWNTQPSIPASGRDDCFAAQGELFCVTSGGTVYNSLISAGTIDGWGSYTSYPGGTDPSCAVGS